MTCADCLDAMLDAEPAELRGDGRSELAGHVRSCLACRRASAAILAGTSVLTRVAHRDRRLARLRRRAAIGGLAAAGIVVAFVSKSIDTTVAGPAVVPALSRPAPAVVESRPAIGSVTRPSTVPALPVRANAGRATRPRDRAFSPRMQAVAIRPTAFVAVPIQAGDSTGSGAAAAREAPAVAVRPRGGRRAAVFRVAESNVTLVWLY
jgi:hypothetical protein